MRLTIAIISVASSAKRVPAQPQRHRDPASTPAGGRSSTAGPAPTRASAAARIWVDIPLRSRSDWCRWARTPRSTWAIASSPRARWVSTRAASSTAYSCGTRQLLEEGAAHRPLPRQRLVQPGQLGEEQPDQRAGDQLGDPAALERDRDAAVEHRALVEALDQLDARVGEQRAEQAGHEVGVPVDQVGVHEDDQLAGGDEERLPHRLALARPGAEVGADLRGAVHGRAGVGRDGVRVVGGVGVDDHDLVDAARRCPPAPSAPG